MFHDPKSAIPEHGLVDETLEDLGLPDFGDVLFAYVVNQHSILPALLPTDQEQFTVNLEGQVREPETRVGLVVPQIGGEVQGVFLEQELLFV